MAAMTTEAPYGSWRSPLSADRVVEGSVSLGGPAFGAGDLWWSELRPSEGGRVQIVRKALDAPPEEPGVDVLPEGFSARTRVHEYGGGAWWLGPDGAGMGDTLFFACWDDQRLYRIDRAGTPDASAPIALTPEPVARHALRYADGDVTPDGAWAICVREAHGMPGTTEAQNELVAIRTGGAAGRGEWGAGAGDGGLAEPIVLVGGDGGPDFVSSPRVHPDGQRLCWIQWNHPDMPWDATELCVAEFDAGHDTVAVGAPTVVCEQERVDGEEVFRPGRSWMQPRWVPEVDQLWAITDPFSHWHDGHSWQTADSWGLRGFKEVDGSWRAVDGVPPPGELGEPAWVFGQSSYCITDASNVTMSVRPHGSVSGWAVWHDGIDRLCANSADVVRSDCKVSFTSMTGLTAARESCAMIVGSFSREPEIVTLSRLPLAAAGDITVHRPARDLGIGEEWFSVPEAIAFPTPDDGTGITTAHAIYYPPHNPDFTAPRDADGDVTERPPLIVLSHGGPTSAARPMLQLSVQFWTTRGFAVVDVNYRGSTGYGRAYREALEGRWGIVDVDDCIAAARFLVARGDVDADRLIIRGGSAGGYTTLCALTFHDDFAAGCSQYGVADLEALARDTHKFESRYLDRLVGPYPERADLYRDRSPIHHTDRLATPLLILQGLEDEIVPPAQAEMMAGALRAKGVPFAYLAFEGEQHGFRQAANIRRALEAELYFYSRILGFDLPDGAGPEPIVIENL